MKIYINFAKVLGKKQVNTDDDWIGGGSAGWASEPQRLITGFLFILNTHGVGEPANRDVAVDCKATLYTTLLNRELDAQ